MSKHTVRALAALALAAGLAAPVAAQVTIVDWNLEGQPGTQASTPAASAAAGITGTAITRGAGLNPGATTTSNSMTSLGWNGSDAGDYFSFGFSVDSGYTLDLAGLYIGTRSSGTGPGTLGLYYSGDSFASALYTFDQAGTTGGTGFLNSFVDLSALPDLSGATEFRIYEIGDTQADGVGATASTGTFRLTSYFVGSTFDRNLQFTGTVNAVPEPSTYALVLGGLLAAGFAARRRNAR